MLVHPGEFTLEQLLAIHSGGQKLTLAESARAGVRASARVVQAAADGALPVYGVSGNLSLYSSNGVGFIQLILPLK